MESENKQENEGNEASNTVDLLGNVDVAPADKSSSLLSEIKHLESLVEQLEQVNADQKAQILRLQKERTRKSVIMLSPTPPPAVKEDEEEIPGNEGAVKLESFLKFFQSKTVSDSQLLLHGVNFLVSVYQMVYAKERPGRPETPSESETASKIAFNYVLEFMRQVNNLHVNAVVSSNRFVDFGYPIHWLISLFPYAEQGHTTDQLWMPLHFALAIDTSTPGFDHDSYLVHMEVLLTAYGAKAFDEDVSPLSIAVSTARPNLDAVRLILEYRPDCVRKPDEDGSLPFMHACANNVGLETIEFLYEQFPAAATATDNFGCAAIHYAAFYGTPQAVGFLLQVEPSCATLVEGNGALPLHDAVQNRRCSGTTEMVELLLQAHPGGVRQRDDYGALPLHMAAKAATLNVVQLLHRVFPKAVYGPDAEGLLPMHYVAERHDKDQHLDLLQFVVQANPQSQALNDAALFAVEPDPASSSGQQGGWRGAIKSMWGGSSVAKATAPLPLPAAAQSASKAGSTSSGSSSSRFASTPPSPPSAAHNRRKSVRPVRGSIHEQYSRK